MPRRFNDRPLTSSTRLGPDELNRYIVAFDTAIAALEETKIDWLAQVQLFNTNALRRVSEAVQPLMAQIQDAIDGGLLVAETDSLAAFEEGERTTIVLTAGSRVSFQPTPFVAATRSDTREDWAICRVISYDSKTGIMVLQTSFLAGNGSERDGWTISDAAGIVPAVAAWADDVAASLATILTAKSEVLAAKEAVNAAAILIAGGPVSSVNGQTGTVEGLATTDDLASAIAAISESVGDAIAAQNTSVGEAIDAINTSVGEAISSLTPDLTKAFSVVGSISAGDFVALRGDGAVERVSGEEKLLALISDQLITASSNYQPKAIALSPDGTKAAILIYTTGSMLIAIAAISDGEITSVGAYQYLGNGANSRPQVCWHSNGQYVFVAYPIASTSNIYCHLCYVSGLTVTIGSFDALSGNRNEPELIASYFDSALDRFILVNGVASYSHSSYVMVTIYRPNLSTSSPNLTKYDTESGNHIALSCDYDPVNKRLFTWSENYSGASPAQVMQISASAISTTASLTPSGFSLNRWCLASPDIVLSFGTSAGNELRVYTISGTTLQENKRIKLTANYSASAYSLFWSGTYGIAIALDIGGTSVSDGAMMWSLSLSGSDVVVEDVVSYPDLKRSDFAAMELSDGAVMITSRLQAFGGNKCLVTISVKDGKIHRSGSVPLSDIFPDLLNLYLWHFSNGVVFQGYTETGKSKVATFTPAIFDSNSEAWIGVADADASEGEVKVKLKGAIAAGQSGLTPGGRYYLMGDGSLTTADNGLEAGVALSATELRLAS